MDLDELRRDLLSRHIVCPLPQKWAAIHKILLAERHENQKIPNPLILAGWGYSDLEKSYRFFVHLEIAKNLGILSKVVDYLNSLNQDDFLYSLELSRGLPLNSTGYWDLAADDAVSYDKILGEAIVTLKEVQAIDPGIVDEDALYERLRHYEFFPEQKFEVRQRQSVLDNLLLDLIDAHERTHQECGTAARTLEDFCADLFDFKNRAEEKNSAYSSRDD